MFIPLSSPDITVREEKAVREVLTSRFLAMGPKIREFEQRIAETAGCRHGIAVNSGTSGLHLLVRALGLGDGDEVITTPFSFIASANCLLFERARPVFVDIDPDTLNMDASMIEAAVTARTRAILPVHVFGQPAAMDDITAIAQQHGLRVIEDACEAIGASYRGRPAGSFGDGAVFAFYPNKQITTGEGGVIVTGDPDIASLCRSMSNQGRDEGGGWFDHERLGYNYRMPEISAALGLAQLERLPEIMKKRARVAEMYYRRLDGLDEVRLPFISPDVMVSWFVYVVRLAEGIDRDGVIGRLREQGVESRPYFAPIHLQPYYRERFGYREGNFPLAEAAGRSALALPFYSNLTAKQVDYVTASLVQAIGDVSL